MNTALIITIFSTSASASQEGCPLSLSLGPSRTQDAPLHTLVLRALAASAPQPGATSGSLDAAQFSELPSLDRRGHVFPRRKWTLSFFPASAVLQSLASYA